MSIISVVFILLFCAESGLWDYKYTIIKILFLENIFQQYPVQES